MPETSKISTSRKSESRVALVTGAGRGIGREVAEQLLARGWSVGLLSRRSAALTEVLESAADAARDAGAGDDEVARLSERILPLTADVADEEQVASAFRLLDQVFGRIDVLVNNAGTFGPAASIEEVDPREWRTTIDTNLTGAFLCAREAFVRMRERGGRIINNGSISARRPRPHSAAYAASKHGLAGLTRAIALDGRPYGITATQIDIGNAATGLLDEAGISAEPLQADGRRVTEPSFGVGEAARAIVYLAELPPEVTVHDFVLTASGMPYDGRG